MALEPVMYGVCTSLHKVISCVYIKERHWVPIPVHAGMGRVWVHLKLNGWVQMGAHIYYTMASRVPGRLTASTKLGLGLRIQGPNVFTIKPWLEMKLRDSPFPLLSAQIPGWIRMGAGNRWTLTVGYGWVCHLRMGSRMWPGVAI
jgi:hypothetical protein